MSPSLLKIAPFFLQEGEFHPIFQFIELDTENADYT